MPEASYTSSTLAKDDGAPLAGAEVIRLVDAGQSLRCTVDDVKDYVLAHFDIDLTTWAGITRASGFDAFAVSPSSANLKSLVTDETGSGALVFATSPTLVTPNIGTPSAGTLTNCTGLPYTGVSGMSANVVTLLGAADFAAIRTSLSLVAGTNIQAYSANLTTFAGISPSANVQTLLGALSYAAFRTSLGVVPGTDVQAYSAVLATYAGITPSANVQALLAAANYSAFRTSLGIVPGTDVQAYSANLATFAGIAPSTNVQTLLGAANYSAIRTSLGVAIGSDIQAYHARLADITGVTFAQGDILYYNGANIVKLAAGASGYFLKTEGSSANPVWASVGGGGDMLTTNNLSDVANKATARTNLSMCFSAHKNTTDQTGIASNTWTKLTFTTEEFDVGGYYDNTNSKIVPPAGKWRLSAATFLAVGVTVNTTAQIALYKNGAKVKQTIAKANGAETTVALHGSWLVDANGTDYFEIYVTAPSAGTLTAGGQTDQTYFQGEAV